MISDSEGHALTLLSMLVEQKTGLHHATRDRPLLAGKLKDHAELHGFDSLLDFYRSIAYDDPTGARMAELVDALVVGETYFLRERPGLERVVELAADRARRGLRTRIWSAACATGEEVLSVAALAATAGVLDSVDLVASDVSDRQLARARSGQHTVRALRLIPEGLPPWIDAVGGRAVVHPDLRARVRWHKVNLVDRTAVLALGRFDVILCRNVLIYFDEPTVVDVVGSLSDALHPGGTLLVGTSESLLRFSTRLACVEKRGVFLYQRPTP